MQRKFAIRNLSTNKRDRLYKARQDYLQSKKMELATSKRVHYWAAWILLLRKDLFAEFYTKIKLIARSKR